MRPTASSNPISLKLCFRRAALALAFLFAAAWIAACGKVGAPRPPEILIPQAVTDLTSRQIGPGVRLSWTLPTLNTNGSKATTIRRIEVYREMQPSTAPLPAPKTIAEQFRGTMILTIDIANLPAFTEHGQMVFTDQFPGIDPATLPTNRFWYAVKVINKKKQDAGYSNIIIRPWLPIPPPVPHIDFRAEETALEVTWDVPASAVPIEGYNVYRSEQSKARPLTPLNDTPIKENRYADKNFQFGTTYYYMVRAVVRTGTITAESSDSPEFAFKPIDVFPPKIPTGLTVVFADGKMNLLWDPNMESDFAGYSVYRSEDGVTFKKISAGLLKSPTFRDENAQHGKKYEYRVTATDTSGNESSPCAAVSQIAEGPN